jgi:glycosyltransferase involved in cell wall biosynthesis
VVPRKDHRTLVDALARLTQYDWRGVCVGSLEADPACASGLRKAITDAVIGDRVELTGELGDTALNERYALADLFVLPTRYEGFGMAFTEAVARGVPVIAGDGGAVREAVPAEAARFVPPGDPDALARVLAGFMADADERAALRAGARAGRERLADWRGQARHLKQALDSFRDA